MTQKLKFVQGREGNIVGKGENSGYQHFLLFPQCFQKASILGLLKAEIVWYKAKLVNKKKNGIVESMFYYSQGRDEE